MQQRKDEVEHRSTRVNAARFHVLRTLLVPISISIDSILSHGESGISEIPRGDLEFFDKVGLLSLQLFASSCFFSCCWTLSASNGTFE